MFFLVVFWEQEYKKNMFGQLFPPPPPASPLPLTMSSIVKGEYGWYDFHWSQWRSYVKVLKLSQISQTWRVFLILFFSDSNYYIQSQKKFVNSFSLMIS